MEKDRELEQWQLCVVVFHGASMGHRVEVLEQSRGRDPWVSPGGRWRGLGIPEQVLNDLRSKVDSMLTEHLVTRYGVAGELPLKWSGEPEPF